MTSQLDLGLVPLQEVTRLEEALALPPGALVKTDFILQGLTDHEVEVVLEHSVLGSRWPLVLWWQRTGSIQAMVCSILDFGLGLGRVREALTAAYVRSRAFLVSIHGDQAVDMAEDGKWRDAPPGQRSYVSPWQWHLFDFVCILYTRGGAFRFQDMVRHLKASVSAATAEEIVPGKPGERVDFVTTRLSSMMTRDEIDRLRNMAWPKESMSFTRYDLCERVASSIIGNAIAEEVTVKELAASIVEIAL